MPRTLSPSFLLGAAMVVLAGCATPTLYAPVKGKADSGYWETRIEENRFRVSFRGGSGESAGRVKDLALLRAADLAVANGFEWLEVVNQYGETNSNSGATLGIGGGTGGYGRGGGVDIGVGTSFDLTGPIRTQTLEVLMGKGAKPDRPNAYAAESVRKTINATKK